MRGDMVVCAALDCGANVLKEPVYLERITPKGEGKPFFGLCQNCRRKRNVELRPEAAEAVEGR